MAIFQHGNKQRLDFTIKGERIVKSFNTKEDAAAYQAKVKARVALGLPAREETITSKDMLLSEALKLAIRKWDLNRSSETAVANAIAVVDFLGARRKISTLTVEDQHDLVDHLLAIGNSTSTINRKLSALSCVLRAAADKGVPVGLRLTKLKETDGRIRVLSFLEERNVFTLLGEQVGTESADFADLVALAIDTGARCSELLAIQPGWVRPSVGGGYSVTFPGDKTKSGRTRTIPLTQRGVSILHARMASGGPMWDVTWNVDKVGRLWSAMRLELGLHHDTEFVFHACRHTCATRLLEATGNLVLVRDWLGHKDIKTTTIYAKLVAGSLKEGAAALDGLSYLNTYQPIQVCA